MPRKWLIAKKITNEFRNQFPEINPLVLQLLYNRGLRTQEAIDEFTNPDYGQDVHDPFLFSGMERAVGRIFQAIKEKEKITVHGDYDADGVCATAILVSALKELGAEVEVYIPHRVTEGYGLNNNTVNELKKNGTKLIITVDCGIASKEEVLLANKKGMTVIITDHHEQPPELPPAYAIINPHVAGQNYPFKELAGSGVAFKLAQALVIKDGGKKIKEGYEKWLLDLVAVGTIADCVSLVGENRTLCKYGLVVLRKTRRAGLRELVENTRFSLERLSAMDVSFGIAPRLNAAGRLNHANNAYHLLMTNDREEAKKISDELNNTNQDRQRITDRILKEAKEQIGRVDKQKILFALGADWPVGVVGLVAGRLSDEYARPAVVMGAKGDEIVGSGRSIPTFDITAALIDSREYLERFGGHASACGFTLKKAKLSSFKKSLARLAGQAVSQAEMVRSFLIDSEVSLAAINWELVGALENFEPFGEGNRQPRFATHDLEISDLSRVGSDGKHLRLMVGQAGISRKIIAFGFGNSLGNDLKIGDRVDIIFEISVNEWNGSREIQLKLVDFKKNKNE